MTASDDERDRGPEDADQEIGISRPRGGRLNRSAVSYAAPGGLRRRLTSGEYLGRSQRCRLEQPGAVSFLAWYSGRTCYER